MTSNWNRRAKMSVKKMDALQQILNLSFILRDKAQDDCRTARGRKQDRCRIFELMTTSQQAATCATSTMSRAPAQQDSILQYDTIISSHTTLLTIIARTTS